MTRKTKPIEMPILTIEAILQIQDFLHLALDIFEDHYSEQLESFYKPMWDDSPELDLGDFSTFGKPKVCWTGVVQECNNSAALVINTVKGTAVGSNCHVRAAAAPAYFGTGLLQRSRRTSAMRHTQPKNPRCGLSSASKTHQAIIESIRWAIPGRPRAARD